MPASPILSRVRASPAKSRPAMVCAKRMTASIAGVGTATAAPSALIGINPTGTSSAMYLCVQEDGVPGRLVGAIAVCRQQLAGFGEALAAHAVGPLEPVFQIRHARPERGGDGNPLGIDRGVKAADRRRHAFGVEFVRFAPVDLSGI